MARAPRHSKPKSESITIDLDKDDVKPVEENTDETDTSDNSESIDENTPDKTDASEEETEKGEAVEAQQPKDQKKSSGSVFGAGLVGAVLALVGAAGLQWANLIPNIGNNSTEAITTLEEKIATLEENLGQTNTQITEKLAEQPAVDTSPLVSRLDAIETLVQNDNASSLEALNTVSGQIDQLTSRIFNLENNAGSTATGEVVIPENLTTDIANLLSENAKQAETIADLQAQIVSLAQSASQDQNISETITDLQKRVAEAETAIAAPRNDVSIARSLAATSVKNAIDRGGSFIAELNAFEQIDPEHSAISDLKPLAEKGVLKRSDIIANFTSIANQIIAADRTAEGDNDIMSRLLNSAASMVKVRQIGDVEGDTAEAIVARAEIRLNDGNLNEAARELEKLSDNAKAAAQSFQIQLNDRILAEELSAKLMQASSTNAS